jgi:hypothetical protein
MSTLEIIFLLITFVIPTFCILADDKNWARKK